MNKKKASSLKDPFFIGIVLLQVALFGVIGPNTRGDSLSANQLLAAVTRAGVAEGDRLPPFTAYNERGRRQEPLLRGRPATVIFKADCTCDKDQVLSWIEVAQRRGTDVTVIVPVSPQSLAKVRKENGLPGRLLAIRLSELLRVGLVQEHLPTAVHLLPNGTVLAVQSS